MSYVYIHCIFNLLKLTYWNKWHIEVKLRLYVDEELICQKEKIYFSLIILCHSANSFLIFPHKWEIFTVIEVERFIMYIFLTLFVRPLSAKLRIRSCSILVWVLITSFCALPCPSFSRNSGRISRRNICENCKVESRE